MTTLKEKIEAVRKHAPTQPDIMLCARILAVCDAAQKMDELVNAKPKQQGHYDSQGYCDNPARGY